MVRTVDVDQRAAAGGRQWPLALLVALSLALTALLAGAPRAAAATTTTYAYPSGTATSGCTTATTTVADECDLQDAITAAGADGTVVLEAGSSGATFTTTSGFTISQNDLTIEAAIGVAPTLEAGSGAGVVLDAKGTGTLTVQDVTVRGSDDGIDATAGAVSVTGSTITDNSYYGIYATTGAVSVTDSTITDNFGGIYATAGAVSVTDSTIAGNSTYGILTDGAGVSVTGSTITGNGDWGIDADDEPASVTGSTITGNSGWGIESDGGSVAGSIVVGNGADCREDLGGALTDGGYNLGASGGGCGFGTGAHDVIVSTASAADMGALADNGGPMQTVAPGSDSGAIGVIPSGTVAGSTVLCPAAAGATDQRGVPDPVTAGARCDIGALQTVPTRVTVTPTASTVAAGATVTLDVTVASTLAAGNTNPPLPALAGTVSVSIGSHTGSCSALTAGTSAATATSTCTITAPSLTTTANQTVAIAYTDTGTSANGYRAASASAQVQDIAAPTITNVSPSSGPTAGGTSVTITGTNLATATGIDFGAGNPATVLSDTATSITVTTPAAPAGLAGGAGAVTVSITTPGGTATDTGGYSYTAPPSPTTSAPPSVTVTTTSALPSVTVTTTGAVSAGRVRFAVSCTGGTPGTICSGKITLTIRRRMVVTVHHRRKLRLVTITLGRVGYRTASGDHRALTLRLTRTASGLLAGARRHRLTVRETVTLTGGHTHNRTITLRLTTSHRH